MRGFVASQVNEFISQVQTNNAEYVAVISGCSDESWARIGPNDERTVGVIALHMATVQGGLARLIEAVMAGNRRMLRGRSMRSKR